MKTKANEFHDCDGWPTVRHLHCGGQVACDGHGHISLFRGCGYVGRVFTVHRTYFKTVKGFCLKCRAAGHFVRIETGQPTTTTPKHDHKTREALQACSDVRQAVSVCSSS